MTPQFFRLSLKRHGLTLPETLVALVGMAIVVLSILAVHVERLQVVPGAELRGDAKALAEAMAAIVRDGRYGAARYENPIGIVCRAETNRLTVQELAANEVACWQDKVSAGLPNGAGTISTDENSYPPAYVITVSWSQPGARTASYVLRLEDRGLGEGSRPNQSPNQSMNQSTGSSVPAGAVPRSATRGAG